MKSVTILLAVLAMLAVTAGAETVFTETFDDDGTSLGEFESGKNYYAMGGDSYPFTHNATVDNTTARPGGDGYSMKLAFPDPDSASASAEGKINSTVIATNGQYTVDVYMYWPSATTGTPGVWSELNITFNNTRSGARGYDWPNELDTGSGAWWGLLKDAEVLDGTNLNLQLFTCSTAGGGTAISVATTVPTDEWIHLVVEHTLDGGGANGQGTATYYAYAQNGTTLHTGTVDLVDGSAPATAGIIGITKGEACGVVGDVYIDDYIITSVPEPATMMLLGIGGIGVLIRRKRR